MELMRSSSLPFSVPSSSLWWQLNHWSSWESQVLSRSSTSKSSLQHYHTQSRWTYGISSTVYDIISPTGTNYLAFMCWIGLWSLVFHWILAVTNSCNWLKYVTRFPCDIFGFYVAFIYLQKGIQVLEILGDEAPFYLSVMVALLVFMVAYACGELGGSPLFWHPVRVFLKDYGTPLTVIFFTGFVHIGRMRAVELEKLPTSASFFPTADRGWFIHFWDISVSDVFLAIPFAILLTILFWFDHNGMPTLIRTLFLNILTLLSLVLNCARHRIPPSKTCWLSLGPLSPRLDNRCSWSSGSAVP